MENYHRVLILGTAVLIAAILGACGQSRIEPIAENRPIAYIDPDGTHEALTVDTLRNPLPHLKFADGQITLNNRCPVRQVRLNIRLPGVYVNGHPVGFC